MKSICLIFQIHQPFRLRKFRFFDIGAGQPYYDDHANETHIRKLASQCYLPANNLFLKHIDRFNGKLKIALAISGVTLEQFDLYAPEVSDSFRKLAETGHVEFLGGTYGHSLSSQAGEEAFSEEALLHKETLRRLSGRIPEVFLNTEMIYSDTIGAMIAGLGYKGVVTEGARHILGWKSPGFVYCNAMKPRLKVLMRHMTLSDDLMLRFSDREWSGYPLTADKYLNKIRTLEPEDGIFNICLDYETFGNYHPGQSGIFNFLDYFIYLVTHSTDLEFTTPSEAFAKMQPVSIINVANPVSSAGEERDLSLWNGNDLQTEALEKLYQLRPLVKNSQDPTIARDWRTLQSSDNFLYMSTIPGTGPLHNRQNPYNSPFEAFINFMNIQNDLRIRINPEQTIPGLQDEIAQLKRQLTEKERIIKELQKEIHPGKRLRQSQ